MSLVLDFNLIFSSEMSMETSTDIKDSLGTYFFGLLRVMHESFLGENSCFSVPCFLSEYF